MASPCFSHMVVSHHSHTTYAVACEQDARSRAQPVAARARQQAPPPMAAAPAPARPGSRLRPTQAAGADLAARDVQAAEPIVREKEAQLQGALSLLVSR